LGAGAAPVHYSDHLVYSLTWSVPASRQAGSVASSALALLTLIGSSTLVGYEVTSRARAQRRSEGVVLS